MKRQGIELPIPSSSWAAPFGYRRIPRRPCVSKTGEICPAFLLLPTTLMHEFELHLFGLYVSSLLGAIFNLFLRFFSHHISWSASHST